MTDSQSLPAWNLRSLFALVTIALVMLVSGPVLSFIGVEYAATGGSPLAKIHPASYFTFGAMILMSLLGEYNKYLLILRRNIGLFLFFVSVIVLELYTIIFTTQPATVLVDTFLLAGLVYILIMSLNERECRLAATFLDLFMFVNSIIAIGELLLQRRFIPATVGSITQGVIAFPYEWRPSGFLGHPLSAALITACYILIVLLRRPRTSQIVHFGILGLSGVALLAYASRSAVVFFVVAVAVILAWIAIKTLLGMRTERHVVTSFAFLLPVGIVGVTLLLSGGFLDRFLARVDYDGGSASARSIMVEFLSDMTVQQYISGIPNREAAVIFERYNMFAVESFWIGFLIFYGLIGVIIFFPGLFLYCQNMIKNTDGYKGIWPVLYFFAIQSGQVGISSKSLALVQLTILVLVFLRSHPARKAQVGDTPPARADPVRPPRRPRRDAGLGGSLSAPSRSV